MSLWGDLDGMTEKMAGPQGGESKSINDIFANTPESTDFKRDRWGRPVVRKLGANGPITAEQSYRRVTTLIKVIDDTTALMNWKLRFAAKGIMAAPMAETRRLYDAITAEDSTAANRIIDSMMEAAGIGDQARAGTAIHSLTQRWDEAGEASSGAIHSKHLDAWRLLTADFIPLSIERHVVCDEICAGGTPDRVWQVPADMACPVCGSVIVIGDLKTGRVDSYTERSISMQMSIYSKSRYYDIKTGERTSMGDVCQHRGIVVMIPAKSEDPAKESQMFWIDLTSGWDLVQTALMVHDARKVKGLLEVIR